MSDPFLDDLQAKGLVSPGGTPSPDDDEPPAWLKKSSDPFAADLAAKKVTPAETRPLANTGPDLADQLKGEAQVVPQPTPFADLAKRTGESFRNLGSTLATGASAIATGVAHPIDTATNPSRRHEFERGLDDVLTLGQGQKLAARIGNAAGDVGRGESLNETRKFSVSPGAGDANMPSQVEAQDAQAAPGFRAAGNLAGMALPSIPAAAAGKVASFIPGTGARLQARVGSRPMRAWRSRQR